jgi:PKD repeat protein
MTAGMRPAKALLALLVAAGCNDVATPDVRDAGPDAVRADAGPPSADAPVALAVDFTLENCPAFDAELFTCTGTVPLAVRFVPLTTTTVTKYLWVFGDGSTGSDAAPSHVYTSPKVYTVKIIATGAGGGLVTKIHEGFIIALPAPAGARCDADLECTPGLSCICSPAGTCANGPTGGLCAAACASGRCATGQVCAGLLTAEPPATGAEAWQQDLCLAGCASDADCALGLHCRTLPPPPSGSAWVHGCFATDPRDIGQPCTDATGNRRNDLCAGGLCAELGALGMCSSDCTVQSCPPGSDCAELGDGRRLCLRSCVGFDCSADALLGCMVPTEGDLGYRILGQASNASSSYCAPKSCTADGDCLPAGICASAAGSGHCVRR